MRAFSYACSLLVMHVTKMADGHTIRSAVITAYFMEPELLTGEDCGKRDFRPFLLL